MANRSTPSGADEDAPKRKAGPRRLVANVHLTDPETGEVEIFKGGTLEKDLPEGIASRITNPSAFTDEPEADEE